MTAKNTTVSLRIKQHVILVDADDWARLCNLAWHVIESGSGHLYVAHSISSKVGHISMHRMILSAPKNLMIDHINGNGLDNRKENLRLATNAQNQYNRRKTHGVSSSKFKGVSFTRARGRWAAQIRVQKRLIWLGYYQTEEEAALAYNAGAIKHYGAFAKLNPV